jgi:hypothetical protein
MAIIIPVYERVADYQLTGHDFTVTAVTALSGLDLGAATEPLSKGLLCGMCVTLQDNTGPAASDYKVELYTENSATLTSGTAANIYTATFSFGGVGRSLTDMLATPIPLFAQPFIRVAQTTTATDDNTLRIKFFVQATAN